MKKAVMVIGVAFVAAFVVVPAFAQDPVKVAPQAFKERLNNDKVRVLEYTSKPGSKEPMHTHGEAVLYVIHGGKFKSTTADGVSKVIVYKTGDVLWRDALTHTGENVGTTEMRALVIEIKGKRP